MLTNSPEGADTELARMLQACGRLPADQLGPLLERIRVERRTNPHASLGALLLAAGFVTRAELDALDQRPRVAAPAPAPWRVGEQVGGYRLEAVLGRGGAGVVFRATHLATGRAVALKGLHSADPQAAERFMREAAAQATADGHPHVVRVYDAGLAEGRPFLAMELLPQGDLLDRLKRGGFSTPRDAAELVAKLARGLAHIHASGVLHRDLKPENVLFDPADEPKLVDFGVAYVASAETLTQTGQLLGTPEYMAPEQALGLTHLDVRADVYGLGAILYTCLTGRPPFVGELSEVIAQLLAEDPPRPRTLRPGLDPALEALCLRALAKRPEDRVPDAVSLAEALEAYLAPQPSAVATEEAPSRSLPRIAAGAIALACLGLGVGAGAWAAHHLEAPSAAVVEAAPAVTSSDAAPNDAESDPAPLEEAPDSAPRPEVPRLGRNALEVGAAVMVRVPGEASRSKLGWIAEVHPDPARPEVSLLLDGTVVGPLAVPVDGFALDAFGVGAEVLDPWEGVERRGAVLERKGPLALVEYTGGERAWCPVLRLVLLGRARRPRARRSRSCSCPGGRGAVRRGGGRRGAGNRRAGVAAHRRRGVGPARRAPPAARAGSAGDPGRPWARRHLRGDGARRAGSLPPGAGVPRRRAPAGPPGPDHGPRALSYCPESPLTIPAAGAPPAGCSKSRRLLRMRPESRPSRVSTS
ncbi:MAG: serine/threonine-protein kinase [Planctomycetota bacterium]